MVKCTAERAKMREGTARSFFTNTPEASATAAVWVDETEMSRATEILTAHDWHPDHMGWPETTTLKYVPNTAFSRIPSESGYQEDRRMQVYQGGLAQHKHLPWLHTNHTLFSSISAQDQQLLEPKGPWHTQRRPGMMPSQQPWEGYGTCDV